MKGCSEDESDWFEYKGLDKWDAFQKTWLVYDGYFEEGKITKVELEGLLTD